MRVHLHESDIEKLCRDGHETQLILDSDEDDVVKLSGVSKDNGQLMYYLYDNREMRTDHMTAEQMADYIGPTILQPSDYERLFAD